MGELLKDYKVEKGGKKKKKNNLGCDEDGGG